LRRALNESFRHADLLNGEGGGTLEVDKARVVDFASSHQKMFASVHRFDRFVLDVGSRELRTPERSITMQSQPFEILLILIRRAGHVVGREELCRRLWPDGTFVDYEHSLNAAIKRLRNSLGDAADRPRFIATVPRRGYRFIARVFDDRAARASTVPPSGLCARLAVLPLTHGASDRRFAEGFTEELRTQLGRMSAGAIAVIARSSSTLAGEQAWRASEIGEALRVDYLLEGSVRGDSGRLRITVCLVETSGETHVWSDSVECDASEPISTQVALATRFALSLTHRLVNVSSLRQANLSC
jgi:DNA-binding winged helix-turn-helix (wHTH) protein